MDFKKITLAVTIVAALVVGAGLVAYSLDTPTASADQAPADAASAADNDDVQSGFQGEQEGASADADEANQVDAGEAAEVDDETEEAAAIESARISEDTALAAASAQIEGTVVETELDSEDGVPVWSIEFDSGFEAKVDATTGEFLGTEADSD